MISIFILVLLGCTTTTVINSQSIGRGWVGGAPRATSAAQTGGGERAKALTEQEETRAEKMEARVRFGGGGRGRGSVGGRGGGHGGGGVGQEWSLV